jgi:hypothetical protein
MNTYRKVIYISLLTAVNLFSQCFIYDFSTKTGIHETDTSTVFLPQAQSGTSRVRVGSGGGGFYLNNPGIEDFGTDSELKAAASATSSVNKFSIYEFGGGQQFYMKFLVNFSGDSTGKWYFCIGNGNTFSNNSIFRSSESFSAVRWLYQNDNHIQFEYRKGTSWKIIPNAAIEQNKNYLIELFANNSPDSLFYQKSVRQVIAPFSYDLWVNDTLIADNLSKSLLPDSLTINSFMFYGAYSDSSSALIFLDNIVYCDSLPSTIATLSHKRSSQDTAVNIQLYGNYPNPFNPSTTITFKLPNNKPVYNVLIMIYNLQGKLIDRIDLGHLRSGYQKYCWYPKNDLAAGQYIIQLHADNLLSSRKITYLK